jgi:hypothetical protein
VTGPINPIRKTIRHRFGKRDDSPPPNTAFVYRDLDGRIRPGKPTGWAWSAPLIDRTEVDTSRHSWKVDLVGELPSRDGHYFDVYGDVAFGVSDPQEVVRRGIRDLIPIVRSSVPAVMRAVTRNFDIHEASAAEQRITQEFSRGIPLPEGVTLIGANLRLESDVDRRTRPARTADARQPDGSRAARTPNQRSSFDSRRAVFLSYRRSVSWAMAHLVRKELVEHGFDVFMDIVSVDSGQFGPAILTQIENRRHFLLLLEPQSLDRIGDEEDWLRREVAHAIAHRRNIVPLLANGARMPDSAGLPPDVAALTSFNALTVPHDYLTEAMTRLRDRFLRS